MGLALHLDLEDCAGCGRTAAEAEEDGVLFHRHDLAADDPDSDYQCTLALCEECQALLLAELLVGSSE